MRRPLAAVFLLTFSLLIVGTIVFLRSQAAADLVCAEVEARGSAALNASLLIGRCELDPIRIELTFYDLSVRKPGSGVAFDADLVRMKLRELQAPSEKLLVDSLQVVRPKLSLDSELLLSSNGSKEGAQACQLPSLPVRILELSLSEGSVTIRGREGELAKLTGLSLRTQGWSESVSAQLKASELQLLQGKRGAINAIALRGEFLSRASPSFVLEDLSADLAGLQVTMRGEMTDLCALAGHLELEAQGEIKDWVSVAGGSPDLAKSAQGRASVAIGLERDLGYPRVISRWRFEDARLAGKTLGEAHAELRYEGERIELTELSTKGIGGELTARGNILPYSPWNAQLKVEANGGSLSKMIAALGLPGAWVDGQLDGGGTVEGALWPLQLVGHARVGVDSFVVADESVLPGGPTPDHTIMRLGTGVVECDVTVTQSAIQVRQGKIELGDSSLELEGKFPLDAKASVQVSGSLRQLNLTEDLPELAQMAYQGSIRGPVSMSGPWGRLHIEGQLLGRGVSIDGLEAGVVSAHLAFSDLNLNITNASGQRGRTQYLMPNGRVLLGGPEKDFDFQVEVVDGRAQDMVAALLHWHPLAQKFVGLEGGAKGSIRVQGPLEKVSFQVEMSLKEGQFRGLPFERAEIRGGMQDRSRLDVSELTLRQAKGGQLRLRGYAELEGALALTIGVRDLDLGPLLETYQLPLSGRASGDSSIAGTFSKPEGTGALGLEALRFGGTALNPAQLSFHLADEKLSVQAQLRDASAKSDLLIDFAKDESRLNFEWDDLHAERWASLLPTSLRVRSLLMDASVQSKGALSLRGQVSKRGSWQGSIGIQSLKAKLDDATIVLSQSAVFTVDAGAFSTPALLLTGADSTLSLSGSIASDNSLDVSLGGELALAGFAPLLPSFLGNSKGSLSVQASLSGAIEDPVVLGSAQLRNARIENNLLPLPVTQFGGEINFSRRTISLESFSGVAGRGRVDLSGELKLDRWTLSRVHLVGRLGDVHADPVEGLGLTLAGAVFLDGVPGDLLLSGDLELVRGRYEASLGVEQLLPWARQKGGGAGFKAETDTVVRLDLGLRVPGSFKIVTPELDASLQGKLRLIGSLAAPALRGTLDTSEAEAKFRGNRFRVSHAVFDFAGPERLSLNFDLNAETELRDYRVFVHAFGSPKDPKILLDSEPQLAEADLLTLLTLGMTARDAEGLESGEAAFAVMDALFAAAGLDRQVEKFLPNNEILRAPRLRLTSGFSRGNGQVEARVAFESRLFTDALRLRYSAPIGSPGQTATAEYRITDRMSAQAEWDTESRESQLGNLGVDLKLKWEME